ncbi:putative insig domain-protein [Echria macrotheca]|uniref:Insig domain-protein n=1 Tax=Echria macrotheca TaxID=438768 RepID=A0AAJ0B2W7_9PEZI|nr:putative insig domain-protein [Echria macrotheca]
MDPPGSPTPGPPGPGETEGPQIIRPIPRRPFSLHFTTPTPPDEEGGENSELATPHNNPKISAHDLRFLDPRYQQQQKNEDSDLSRATSLMNLTSSTLFGIYAPTTPGGGREDRDGYGGYGEASPWGTGAETPARLLPPLASGVDEATLRLMKKRSAAAPEQPRRGPSYSVIAADGTTTEKKTSRVVVVSSLVLRAALLFGLGMGYGVLVTRLPKQRTLSPAFEDIARVESGTLDWRYLAFWGVAGVVLGSLLPWFDRVWEDAFSARRKQPSSSPKSGGGAAGRGEADWALVVRGIGAFVGIVFAIRKLPWTSTMQVSLTLALANPFLWYLIDRSKPGFLLSAAVGITGGAVLLGVNRDVMPAPAGLLSASSAGGGGIGGRNYTVAAGNGNGGLASQETVEAGIWMVSVLFCSCVCFGNIGRRLALNGEAAARGRWGGVR